MDTNNIKILYNLHHHLYRMKSIPEYEQKDCLDLVYCHRIMLSFHKCMYKADISIICQPCVSWVCRCIIDETGGEQALNIPNMLLHEKQLNLYSLFILISTAMWFKTILYVYIINIMRWHPSKRNPSSLHQIWKSLDI